MSSEWDQTCLVCAIKTENRCSNCAKAGIDLFFCSPDHQKLVWKAHRRVCGPGKANPFTWPLLSQHEFDEIIEHMHEVTGMLTKSNKSIADSLSGCFPNAGPIHIPHLLMGLTRPVKEVRKQQRLLGAVRGLDIMRRCTPLVDRDNMYAVPFVDAISAVAYHEGAYICTSDGDEEPWRTKLRHLMLVELFLLDRWDRTAGQAVPVEWFDRHFARFNDFVRVKVAPTRPEAVEKLLTIQPASVVLADRRPWTGPAA
ncbi:hypothetical protein JCM8208_004673 [Rhodotorula glutinis]